MLVIHKKQIIIILILFISFFSCKKENDTIPNILISKPLSNQSFQIPTSINVIGSTWDDNLITRIEIDIISENSASIVQKKEINVDTNYFDFNISLFLKFFVFVPLSAKSHIKPWGIQHITIVNFGTIELAIALTIFAPSFIIPRRL